MKITRSLRSKRKRGNVMAMVLATIFVLSTIVLTLHHQQSLSRSSLVRAEAELRFREARNFALREHLTGDSTPWGLAVGADLEDQTPETTNEVPPLYSQLLFQRENARWTGLPDLLARESAHAHRYLTLTPTGFGGLSGGVRKGSYRMVETDVPGYAAYAPNGQIALGDVMGWQNPAYDEETASTEAYSGVPAIIGAQGDIEIQELSYGEAHTLSGDITIDEGAGIGFAGALPLPDYESGIADHLSDARSTLFSSSSTGNKTELISEHTGLIEMLEIAFGGGFNPERLLSLRQAMEFPTPMIPGGSMVVPGVVWEVWLHVPFQPDLGFSSKSDPDLSRLTEIQQEQEEAGALLKEAADRLKAAEIALQAAQTAYAANPSEANEDALEEAQDEYNDAQDAVEDIEEFIEESSEEAADIADGKLGGGMSPLPETRAEDPPGRDGQWGWNYSKTIGKMFNLVKTVVEGGTSKELMASISENVRVVHYGPEDEVPGFEWTGNAFVSRSTWTVPAGRTLRFDGDMIVRGDLWLQRGTVMVIDGDLRVESPGTPSISDSTAPSGRVFFEEGSTLIVTGNFDCEGSSHFGSIMVGGEPNEIHPISSALMVDGDVNIPHGIYAGHTIPDLIAGLDPAELGLSGPIADAISGQLGAGANQVQQLMGEMAPLFSKLAGPFHLRNPYFAQYATTFQFITIPFPPVVAVTPIPSPKENLHVFAFRAETFAYTIGLNATLGENLYTQADWWPFGNGVVPMALNLDLAGAVGAFTNLAALESAAELDPAEIESDVETFITTLGERSISWAIENGVQKLKEEGARMLLTPSGFGPIVDVFNDLVQKLQTDEDAVENYYNGFVDEIENQMGGIARDLMGDLLASTNVLDQDEYLRQYAGLLVYGRNINVSSDARQVSGMFVAENDIRIDAELTIGTLMSLNGSIETGDFLYYPYFNQASLYVPAPVPGETAIERAQFRAYGASHDSGMAVQVGPPPVTNIITVGGWDNE